MNNAEYVENQLGITLEEIIKLSNEELDEYTDRIYNKLVDLNLPVIRGAKSRTEYGSSNYLYVDDLKIRVSDHLVTSNARLMGEVHFLLNDNKKDIEKTIRDIEIYIAPERFEKIETPRIVVNELEVCEKQLQDRDSIISERTSKNGNKLFRVKRPYNTASVTYIKKPFQNKFGN